MNTQYLILAGAGAVFLGMLLILAGTLLSATSKSGTPSMRGGGVFFIGPIPLVFGTDRNSAVAVSVLAVILIILFYLFFRR